MMREIYIRPSWLVIVLILLTIIIFAFDYSAEPLKYEDDRQTSRIAPEEPTTDFAQFPNSDENQKCLQCHGQSKYTYEIRNRAGWLTRRCIPS